jgi:hypothetical protein
MLGWPFKADRGERDIAARSRAAAQSYSTWKAAAVQREIDEGRSPGISLEHFWLDEHRKLVDENHDQPVAGLALSGGGIRSATFSLGILQALGAEKLIYKFDYLSTVSGGSYIGSFFGGLFARRENTPAIISGKPVGKDPFVQAAGAVRQLRQFGRYLAPSGAGDLLRGVAIVLRNVVALHFVLGISIMWLALVAVGFRTWFVPTYTANPGWFQSLMHHSMLQAAPTLIALVVPLLIFFSIGLAFWLAPRGDVPDPTSIPVEPITSVDQLPADTEPEAPAAVEAAVHDVAAPPARQFNRKFWWYGVATFPVIGTIGLASVAWLFVFGSIPKTAVIMRSIFEWFGGEFGASQVTTNYWPCVLFNQSFDGVAAIVAFSATVAVVVRIALSFDPASQSERYWDRKRSDLTAFIAHPVYGIGLFVICLAVSAADWGGYLVWYLFKTGLNHGSLLTSVSSLAVPGVVTTVMIPVAQWLIKQVASKADGAPIKLSGATLQNILLSVTAFLLIAAMVVVWVGLAYIAILGTNEPARSGLDEVHWVRLWWWFGGLGLTALSIGYTTTFINLSSLSSLYAGRLRRAYLGAGNAVRISNEVAVDSENEGDDIRLVDYYDKATAGPVHLINVTINETTGKGSHVVQRDRHGRNLVLSPAGLFHTGDNDRLNRVDWTDSGHETLPLSSWIGISGAAFSTGLGARTNLRLALIAGLSNVRLGYWWRKERTRKAPFSTQYHLLRELTASFPGVDGPRWYLSDGGHFENTAAYELIRRRVPFIVISDNGADADYQYEDVANLVRKARIDFDCDIDFLQVAELDSWLGKDTKLRKTFGSLGQIAGNAPSAPTAVAALARVTHMKDGGRDESVPVGTLLLIKPRLTGDGPQDLIRYKAVNGSFPQQSTLDQFFDEDQWESYYHLGLLIGRSVFADNGRFWSPRALLPIPPASSPSPA